MRFREFQAHRAALLDARPHIHDLARHELKDAFAGFDSPKPVEGRVHRCDLSRLWLEAHSMPVEWSERTLISQGVRAALSLIFRAWARKKKRALIAQDVYPVYERIAMEEGLSYDVFPTVPSVTIGATAADLLLLPNPVVPRGDYLRASEVDEIASWVGCDPERRVVIDGVYAMQANLEAGTLRLLETGRAIFLSSLSKLWLSPQIMGVAIVPPQDVPALIGDFRESGVSHDSLRQARALLAEGGDLVRSVSNGLADARARLAGLLVSEGVELPVAHRASGYHTLLSRPWEQLLEENNILALPFEVFGGNRAMSVVTPLAFVRRPS